MIDPFPGRPVLRLGSGGLSNATTPTKAMDDLIADSADHLTDRDPGPMITGTVEAGADFWSARHATPEHLARMRAGNVMPRALVETIDGM